MKHGKKILLSALVLLLTLILVGCGGRNDHQSGDADDTTAQNQTEASENNSSADAPVASSGVGEGIPWPDNEMTRLVPKPEWEPSEALAVGSTLFATFPNTSVEEAQAYGEKLKRAGFSNVEHEAADSLNYLFSASDATGNAVSLTRTSSEETRLQVRIGE